MGHKYVKEDEIFNTSRNGTVPKPTGQDVTDNKFLRADGSWASGAGGSVVSADQVVTSGTEIGGVTVDGVRTAFFAPSIKHTYSATEQIVGTWIDGKPIYEKTITENFTSNTGSVSLASYSIDKLIEVKARGIQPSSNNIVFMSYYGGESDYARWYYRPSDSTLQVRFGSSYGKGEYYITLQYTKTTDSV